MSYLWRSMFWACFRGCCHRMSVGDRVAVQSPPILHHPPQNPLENSYLDSSKTDILIGLIIYFQPLEIHHYNQNKGLALRSNICHIRIYLLFFFFTLFSLCFHIYGQFKNTWATRYLDLLIAMAWGRVFVNIEKNIHGGERKSK